VHNWAAKTRGSAMDQINYNEAVTLLMLGTKKILTLLRR
jgi:hypothetical protein